ncbi:MAG: BLUF domain-containing protein [Sulfurovum sp.]|nr:BLUF domain-containing protein [Sulfurovum sp.]NNJ44796.1 BLUF domain-containing protein [Sulfurovum sp.]
MKKDNETYFFKSLIYVSTAEEHVDYEDILNILTHAWKYNHNSYISGMLLSDNKHFIQVIQGPIATIDKLYARISKDPRHTDIKLIGEELLHERDCTGWGIGFYDKQEVADVFYDSLNVGHGKALYDINYKDAKTLLLALKNVI